MKKTKRTVKQIIDEGTKNRCYVCHKKYPRQTKTIYLDKDEEYNGNMIVTKTHENSISKVFTVWDGESYQDYSKPFCGKACAEKFARYILKRRGKSEREHIKLIDIFSQFYEVSLDWLIYLGKFYTVNFFNSMILRIKAAVF